MLFAACQQQIWVHGVPIWGIGLIWCIRDNRIQREKGPNTVSADKKFPAQHMNKSNLKYLTHCSWAMSLQPYLCILLSVRLSLSSLSLPPPPPPIPPSLSISLSTWLLLWLRRRLSGTGQAHKNNMSTKEGPVQRCIYAASLFRIITK